MLYYESMGYEIYYVNSKQRIGIDVLYHIFTDKLTVLAGQTGVGKSTLLNALMPTLELKTQEISKALGRGKHTTRHTKYTKCICRNHMQSLNWTKLTNVQQATK